MGVMKRIIENQMYAGRGSGGYHFTNENPEVTSLIPKGSLYKYKNSNPFGLFEITIVEVFVANLLALARIIYF